ncbi:hypothetical protein, partial [Streptomyces sp. BE147]|uniref:hypothetical protein n=1 Tax=Streptomyces sp. BE147 TaxID=3002524 RepID=UPI002E79599B
MGVGVGLLTCGNNTNWGGGWGGGEGRRNVVSVVAGAVACTGDPFALPYAVPGGREVTAVVLGRPAGRWVFLQQLVAEAGEEDPGAG